MCVCVPWVVPSLSPLKQVIPVIPAHSLRSLLHVAIFGLHGRQGRLFDVELSRQLCVHMAASNCCTMPAHMCTRVYIV